MSCQGEEDVHLPQKNASASKAGSYASPASQTPSLQGTKGCYEAPRGLRDTHRIGVYKALDFTLPGLMSRYSCTREGKPVSIPNPRDF